MNKPFVCTFFGHRDFNEHFKYENILEKILVDILRANEYVQFLVGRNGEFDIFVSSTIRTVVNKYGFKNVTHTLVLPYATAEFTNNEEHFLSYYDDVEIYPPKTHYKNAIACRNREMVDRADIVICYIVHKFGGAYSTVRYAQNCKKIIINLTESEDVN